MIKYTIPFKYSRDEDVIVSDYVTRLKLVQGVDYIFTPNKLCILILTEAQHPVVRINRKTTLWDEDFYVFRNGKALHAKQLNLLFDRINAAISDTSSTSGGDDQNLLAINNLSDVQNVETARNNLGALTINEAQITLGGNYLHKSLSLGDVQNKEAARINLNTYSISQITALFEAADPGTEAVQPILTLNEYIVTQDGTSTRINIDPVLRGRVIASGNVVTIQGMVVNTTAQINNNLLFIYLTSSTNTRITNTTPLYNEVYGSYGIDFGNGFCTCLACFIKHTGTLTAVRSFANNPDITLNVTDSVNPTLLLLPGDVVTTTLTRTYTGVVTTVEVTDTVDGKALTSELVVEQGKTLQETTTNLKVVNSGIVSRVPSATLTGINPLNVTSRSHIVEVQCLGALSNITESWNGSIDYDVSALPSGKLFAFSDSPYEMYGGWDEGSWSTEDYQEE